MNTTQPIRNHNQLILNPNPTPPKNRIRWLFCAAAVAATAMLATGCTSISYKPAVALGMSPHTIPAKVQLDTFVDQSPPSDKASKAFGSSDCEPGTLQGNLADDVTEAVLTDFNNNQVFESIKRRYNTEPDLIMKGTIHRFYGKFGPTPVFWLTIPIDTIWLFGVPVMSDHGMVDLDVTLQRPNGAILGDYHGESKFSGLYTIYHNAQFSLPTRLNDAFSHSVAQIRQEILRDSSKLKPTPTAMR